MSLVEKAATVLAADANLTTVQIRAVIAELDRYFENARKNEEPFSLSRFRLRVVLLKTLSLRGGP